MPAAMKELIPAYPWVTRGQRYRPVWWDYGQPLTPEIKRGLRRMLSDDAVKPALLTKLFSVSALDWSFTPAIPDSARSRNISDFMLYAARHMDGGTRALVEEVCLHGLVDGLSICEVVWRDKPEPYPPWRGKFCPKCVKAKEHAYLEEDAFGNPTGIYAQTQNGFQSLPPDRFLIFKYLPLFGRPHSDLQAAYQIYTARVILMELWQYGLEKFGQPFAEGVYAPGDTAARDELIAHMEGLKSRTWVVHPDGTRINWVESAFKGEASYQACWEKLTEAIYLSINGAFLQSITSGAGGQRSMRGNSQTQKSTFELFVWHLASVIADVTNEKLWPAVTARNFVGAAPPTAALGGVNDSDLKVSAELDAILIGQLGLKLSIKERSHFYGRQLAESPEDELTGPAPKPSPFGPGGDGPDGSAAGGSGVKPGDPFAAYDAEKNGAKQFAEVVERGPGGEFARGGGRVPGKGGEDAPGGGSGAKKDPAANRPSKPEERHDVEPPKRTFREPPPPKGTSGRKAGGYTATGETNTAIGDKVEALTEQLGFRNILPEGQRHGKNVKEEGSTLDREYDHSGYAFEVKACTTAAKEYKAKPKKEEAEGKRRYAEKHGLKPATCIAVVDADAGEVHYYWREGIGAFALTPTNAKQWNYAGSAKLS